MKFKVGDVVKNKNGLYFADKANEHIVTSFEASHDGSVRVYHSLTGKSPSRWSYEEDLEVVQSTPTHIGKTFEKVEFNTLSDAFRMFEEEDLYIKAFGGYATADEDHVFNRATLYKLIETTLTPLEVAKKACEEFLDSIGYVGSYASFSDFIDESTEESGYSWDEEFIKVMRVTLEAYDNAMKGELL